MKTPTVYHDQQLYRYISTLIQLTPLDAGTDSQVLFFGQWEETKQDGKANQSCYRPGVTQRVLGS